MSIDGPDMQFKRIITYSIVSLIFILESLIACDCAAPGTPMDEYTIRDMVFSGIVVEIKYDSTHNPVKFYKKVTIEVDKVWKGVKINEVYVVTGADAGQCGYPFEIDTVYIVYADSSSRYSTYLDSSDSSMHTDICMRTKRLSEAEEDLQYLHTLSVEDLETALSAIPNRVRLHQNYPNPFNPVTTIRYELPRFSHVRLSVYDILGREVAVLGDREEGPGVREVQWDASTAPSGIYFIQMQAGDFRQVRKVMVLK